MHVRTTHRQRLYGKRYCWDQILNRLRGASLRESLYGARRGSRRSGDMAVPHGLLVVCVHTSCALWGWSIVPISCLQRHPRTGLAVQSMVLWQFSNCFRKLFVTLGDWDDIVCVGISFYALWRFHWPQHDRILERGHMLENVRWRLSQ